MTWRAALKASPPHRTRAFSNWLMNGCVHVVESSLEHRAGSAVAVLRAMQEPPHPSDSDVDELDAAIAGDRLPVRRAISSRTDSIAICLFDTNVISALTREDTRMALWLSSFESTTVL